MGIVTTDAGKLLALIQGIDRPAQGMGLAADAAHHVRALIEPFVAGQTHFVGFAAQKSGMIR